MWATRSLTHPVVRGERQAGEEGLTESWAWVTVTVGEWVWLGADSEPEWVLTCCWHCGKLHWQVRHWTLPLIRLYRRLPVSLSVQCVSTLVYPADLLRCRAQFGLYSIESAWMSYGSNEYFTSNLHYNGSTNKKRNKYRIENVTRTFWPHIHIGSLWFR